MGAEPAIRQNYVQTGQVKLVFNSMLDFGPNSLQAAHAARCAADQQAFWPMHDALFNHQREIYGGDVAAVGASIATELGLDTDAFSACMADQRYADLLQQQDQTRRATGIRTRPTFDINGQLVVGAQGFDAFKGVIEPLLAQ